MVKVGDQYIVTITRKISDEKNGNLYAINGMNTCVLDDYGLERLVPYRKSMDYKQGLLDAFNSFEILSNMDEDERYRVFECRLIETVLRENPIENIINQTSTYKNREDETAIKDVIQQVGDPEKLIKKIKELSGQN